MMKRPLFGILTVWALLLWSAQGCVKPTEPPAGKDSVVCDTCRPDTVVCDTCTIDTTDTLDITPKDTTSHVFTWEELSIPGESKITGCWVFGPKEILISAGSIYKWNGSAFTMPSIIRTDGVNMQGHGVFIDKTLFAFSPEDFWLVRGGIVEHVKDAQLTEYRFEETDQGFLNTAWGTSSANLFVVGNKGAIHQFNGETWTKMESGTTKHLRAVWGTSSKNVWASGWSSSDAESILLHYDGVSWQKVDLSQLGAINAGNHSLITVWATDSAGLTHTVAAGSLVWRKTGNSKWRQDSIGIGNRTNDGGFLPLSVTGNSAIDLIVAGTHGFASHWNGKSWHVFKELHEPGNTFYSALAMSMKDNVICFAGQRPGRSFVQIGTRK